MFLAFGPDLQAFLDANDAQVTDSAKTMCLNCLP